MKKTDEGFTLVELLIVIVILGILATVVVFAVQGITDQGEQNACEVGQRTIETAVEAFYADNRAWPTDVDSLVTAGYIRANSGEDEWAVDGSGNVTATDECTGAAL